MPGLAWRRDTRHQTALCARRNWIIDAVIHDVDACTAPQPIVIQGCCVAYGSHGWCRRLLLLLLLIAFTRQTATSDAEDLAALTTNNPPPAISYHCAVGKNTCTTNFWAASHAHSVDAAYCYRQSDVVCVFLKHGTPFWWFSRPKCFLEKSNFCHPKK